MSPSDSRSRPRTLRFDSRRGMEKALPCPRKLVEGEPHRQTPRLDLPGTEDVVLLCRHRVQDVCSRLDLRLDVSVRVLPLPLRTTWDGSSGRDAPFKEDTGYPRTDPFKVRIILRHKPLHTLNQLKRRENSLTFYGSEMDRSDIELQDRTMGGTMYRKDQISNRRGGRWTILTINLLETPY